MSPWCIAFVCSWRCPLADRRSLPFPWALSLRRRWCPSASHHPVPFLLPYPSLSTSLSFPLAFPSIGRGAHRPLTTPPLSFPLVGCANGGLSLFHCSV